MDCIKHYAHETVFGQGAGKSLTGNLQCCAIAESGGGCEGNFGRDVIKRALTEKEFALYERKVRRRREI
jgi:hypothetical protein